MFPIVNVWKRFPNVLKLFWNDTERLLVPLENITNALKCI